MSRIPPLYCSFCGKSDDQVRHMVTGPGVYICNECVVICVDACLGNVLTNATAKTPIAELSADGSGAPQGAP